MDDIANILEALKSPSATKRSDAFVQLKAMIRLNGGHLAVQDRRAFNSLLAERAVDSSWTVSHHCLELMADLASSMSVDEALSFISMTSAATIPLIGNNKAVIRRASLNALIALSRRDILVLEAIVREILGVGCTHPEGRVRAESFSALPLLIPQRLNVIYVFFYPSRCRLLFKTMSSAGSPQGATTRRKWSPWPLKRFP